MTPALALALVLAASEPRTLTLDQALEATQQNLPALRQARAGAEASTARSRQSLAPMLPQLSMSLGYSRTTANVAPSPGVNNVNQASTISFDSTDYWTARLTLSGTLWDFGRNWNRYQASLSQADAQAANVRAAEQSARLAARVAYFQAAAQRELVAVAKATLANTEAHLAQVDGFVKVGARPDIDLAQSRAERANARLALVNAASGYALAKAKLNQAMGVAGPTDYEVVDPLPGPVEGEGAAVEELMPAALAERPEVKGLEAQLSAQQLTLRAIRAGYWPVLGAQVGVNVGARSLSTPVPNGSLGVTLNWPLYEGGLTNAQVAESSATLVQLEAQRDAVVADVRLAVESALLQLRSSREAVDVAQEALEAAQERLRLAEGRYKAGAGSAIEQGDAQVAYTAAAAQKVQAVFNLAIARAQLLAALGR